jgi:hypothetical protein
MALSDIRKEEGDSFNKSLYRGHPTARVILYRALPSHRLTVTPVSQSQNFPLPFRVFRVIRG